MANIQDEIQAISTAFYGAQVRSAIATGLDSINQEVDSLNSQVTKFDSLAQQMNQIVSEYNTLNTKIQNALQEVNSALKNELENCTLSGIITNNATITGGTYKNACVEDTGINSCGISDSTLSGSIVNKGTINGGTISNVVLDNVNIKGDVNCSTTINGGALLYALLKECTLNTPTLNGGTYNNPTLVGNVEVNNSGSQEALIDYYSETHTQLVAPNVTGKCTISWWLIKAPLLSGQSINGSIGVLTMSITLDSTYNWANNNRQEIDISQLPTSSARTITPTPYFQVGTSQGVLWLAGSNLTLEAGKTYTTKALMWQ